MRRFFRRRLKDEENCRDRHAEASAGADMSAEERLCGFSQEVLGPAAPGRRECWNADQTAGLAALARVDAEDIADGEIVVRLTDDAERVAGADVAFDDDAEISAGALRVREAPHETRVLHAHAEAPAGDARLGDFEDRAADAPTLADERIVDLNAFGREIFAEAAEGNRPAGLALPPA